jgi:nitroreductase
MGTALAISSVNRYIVCVSETNIHQLIQQRRSIRAYDTSRAITTDLLEKVIDAGLWAASGKNFQNWRFYVLQGKKRDDFLVLNQKSWQAVKDVLEKRLKPSLYKFTERFFFTLGDAPVLILAFAELNEMDHRQTQIGNVYLAVENIVLAAQNEGLGTCIMGSPLEIEDEIRSFLNIPLIANEPNLKLVCGLTLGYPAHSPPAAPRRPDRVVFLS